MEEWQEQSLPNSMSNEVLADGSSSKWPERQVSLDTNSTPKNTPKESARGDDLRFRGNQETSMGESSPTEYHPYEGEEQDARHPYFDYDSCSDHGELDEAPNLLGRGRRTRRQLQQRVEGLVRDLRQRQEVFKTRRRNLNQKLRLQFLTQQERLVLRSRQMALKLQSGRSRAWRHKWVFALVQLDFVVSAYWLGARSDTFYLYYTAQMVLTMICKAFDYSVNAQHYFLLDFCFFANLLILAWMWLFPTSGLMYNAADSFCGLLCISIIVFRNSCVPHDFVRISHAYVHYPAVVAMFSVKRHCAGDLCIGMEAGLSKPWLRRFGEAYIMYLSWAVVYASVIFVFAAARIDRKKRDTLYNYFAITLGFRDKLPKPLRPLSKLVFMVGHQSLFLCGVWWIFLPVGLQVTWGLIALIVFFHNGGRFYVDHFWKAYERNTLLYMDAACSAMSQKDGQGAANGCNAGTVEDNAAAQDAEPHLDADHSPLGAESPS